ncbi:hypothetical protein [Streptomyces sp. NPDC058955]|uniref:hypothetical protein n=1 Tax=unclassified Streptomyces TaxID=2593676 RepID=UPI00364AF6A0
MGSAPRHPSRPSATFTPTRPASSARWRAVFLLGGLVWIAAGRLAVALLGHSGILVRLLLVTACSCVFFGIMIACGIAVRRRQESDGEWETHRAPH